MKNGRGVKLTIHPHLVLELSSSPSSVVMAYTDKFAFLPYHGIHTFSEVHTSSYPMGTGGCFPGVNAAGA
jgi:hypothetical protein